ncbi:MAG: hypothetical protein CM15mV34_0180 [Caudoviricetes sp.]|jgi:hypothetical protein|nr:MAG: hypothetical protein CM15mV34_0180 [Caudoviricetes sp.]|tara:strand:+ start:45 stop:359 length:315 start_codon:yes stop_codon:yes gene_type:complete
MEFKEEMQQARNLNDQIKLEKFGMTHNELQELRWHLVDRIVDNMSVEDLVQYVKEDMENMVNDLPDVEFIDQAKDYWEDGYPDVVELIKEYANSDFQKPKEDRI